MALSLGYFQFPQFFSKSAPAVAKSTANEPAALLATSQGPATSPVASIASTAKTSAPLPSPVASASSIRPETTTFLEAVLNKPVSIEHGGALRELALANDELYVRNADGKGRVVTIPSATSASDLLGQIEKLQKETGSAPELIMYPTGAARNDSTRRIVTRDILIEADSRSAADALASASGLSFKSAPVFAKGKYIYEAPSSPEALAFFVKTADSASPYVTPLLASKVAKMAMPNDPLVQKQWHLKFQNQFGAVSGTDVNVESVWKYPSTTKFNSSNATSGYIRGNGVTIGIVDDGMEWSHPDLQPNVLRNLQKDWNGKDNDPKPYFSDDNHGTACAGVAAARGNNRIGVSGVAPEANLVGMRLIADAQTDADIAEAMTWYPDAIHIKSNSWGYNAFTTNSSTGVFQEWNPIVSSDPLTEAALEYAAKYGRGGKGSIITFAAGNSDEFKLSSNGSPQKSGARVDFQALPNSIYTIAVGAVNSLGMKSNYSQVGSSLLISAPSNTSNGTGLGIMTTDNKGPAGYNYGLHNTLFTLPLVDDFKGSGDVTQTFGGTSSATPAVSGVIALMLQRNPNLGWRDVQEILMLSAKKIDDQFPSGTVNNTATGWIVSNRDAGPNPVSGNATVPFKFNDKYGAGLVDAAAAVALSGNWTNLSQQKSQTVTTNATTSIGNEPPDRKITRTFTVNGTNLRAEHVTVALTVTDIPKGNLTITLTSPEGTTSTFCEPHSDTTNTFTSWKFMTVRNWAESSNGAWALTITNIGTTTGNLTDAELVVYGTDPNGTDLPTAMATGSLTKVFAGANITLSATTSNLTANGTVGSVTFSASLNGNSTLLGNGTLSSNSTIPVYEYTWNTANLTGNYLVTANATSGSGASVVTAPIAIQVDPAPIAAWDFDTETISQVPLATAVSSIRKYAANFGSGNLIFNGQFTDGTTSNRWDASQGEIYSGFGTDENTAGEMVADSLSNTALMLRAGKNFGAQGKSLVFEFSMAGQENLNVSYAADSEPMSIPLKDDDLDGLPDRIPGGFITHTWSYSSDGTVWTDWDPITPEAGFSTFTLNQTTVLNNSTTAYLRLKVSGSGATSGQNLIDNIILSATPIAGGGGGPGGDGGKTNAKTDAPSASSVASTAGVSSNGSSSPSTSPAQPDATIPTTADTLDWKLTANLPHQMLVHAEVVDGARFVNAAGSLLSATKDGTVFGLAEPIPQTTRYELIVFSSEPDPALLRLKIYDSESKGILVLEEKVPFASGSTIGLPSTPKRYQVAYLEAEQLLQISPGWNTFTTTVDPDPATLEGALIDYNASEGDRLVGPTAEAIFIQGKWNPPGYELKPQATYSLLRQAQSDSQILLKGKALPQATPQPLHDKYGIWMNLPEGSVVSMDWCDADGDNIDDRWQPGPGLPSQKQIPSRQAPLRTAPAAVQQSPQSTQPTASPSDKNLSKKSGAPKKSSKKSGKKQKATRKS